MKRPESDIIYSEPVSEIIGTPPRKFVRFGTTLIFILFLLFIFFSWILKYPDIIPSPIEITTTNPPVMLVSKVTGRIKHLYVRDREKVSAGQIIAVMETTASVDEIEMLRQILDTLKTGSAIPGLANLGELQEYYSLYRKNQSDLKSFEENDYYGKKIASANQEVKGIREYINRLSIKETYFAENQDIEIHKFKRDSLLQVGKYISDAQIELSRQSLLKNKIDLQQVRLDHSAKEIELSVKQQLIDEYGINRTEQHEKLKSVVEESFLNLKAQLNIWENTYILKSPVDGTATFTRYWSINQSAMKDEPVISVVPFEPGDFVGRINLRMQRSGKVKPDLPVNIKLSGYPYLEYGMVRGVVKSKSLVPSGDAYIIEISLPGGLTTLYGKKLEFNQNMQGMAEIITEDTRLLQKIINPFRHLISKNKG